MRLISIVVAVIFAFVVATAFLACGASETVVQTVVVEREVVVEAATGTIDALNVGTMMETDSNVFSALEVEKVVEVEKIVEVQGETIVQTVVVEREVVVEKVVEVETESAAPAAMLDESVDEYESTGTSEGVDIAVQNQTRIIVRNADMTVQADDPSAMVEAIGMLAVSRGGWIVDSSSSGGGFHYITIRVPAQTLDAVIAQITNSVVKVESVNSTSTDFTEEFIDLGARRITVQETVNALTELLKSGRYDDLEKLLEVQREITSWQTELEKIDGRLRFIQESAAFSRLTVTVNRAPIPMRVDVGGDMQAGLDVQKAYTARFYPPEGYERYEITWDFGDGTGTTTVNSALRTQGEDGLLSVPAIHTYTVDDFSPYVVSVNVRAYSDDGLAEGQARLWAHVSEIQLNVDAGEDVQAAVNRAEQYTARFDAPEGYDRFEIIWDFGDGTGTASTNTAIQNPDGDGYISAPVAHTYTSDQFSPYVVTVQVNAFSDIGTSRGEGKLWAHVSEVSMRVDVGDDVRVGLNVSKAYTARFYPPEGYDRFEIIWDFGDGTGTATLRSAIQTQDAAGYLSAPAVHTYTRDDFSPYVVSVNIKAFSDTGISEGEGKLWAHVSELPAIEPFITAPGFIEEKQEETFLVTFNHPATIRNLQYSWDFRDGSEVQTVSVEQGITSAEISHAFHRWRPDPYEVRFEIWGDSDAGEVREPRSVVVQVHQAPVVDSSDFEPGETATSGLNTLVTVFTFAATVAIWLATTSPIWLIVGALIFAIVWLVNRQGRKRQRVVHVPEAESDDSDEEQPGN